MNLFLIILAIYLVGVIAAGLAIKFYNKGQTRFYDRVPPPAMLLSWIAVSIVSVCAVSGFWENNGKESLNKFFNYE